MTVLNSTDEQTRHFLVCSLCEMLNNVKSEKFTLVFLREQERRTTEDAENHSSSKSAGIEECF